MKPQGENSENVSSRTNNHSFYLNFWSINVNIKNLFLLTITSSAIAFSGLAFSAGSEKTEPASEVKNEQAPAKKKVRPHSHPRDAKGMYIAEKSDGKSDSEAEKNKPDTTVKPHNHTHDAKAVGVSDKPVTDKK